MPMAAGRPVHRVVKGDCWEGWEYRGSALGICHAGPAYCLPKFRPWLPPCWP